MELQCLMVGLAVISGYACMGSGGRKPNTHAHWDLTAYTSTNSLQEQRHGRDVWSQESISYRIIHLCPSLHFKRAFHFPTFKLELG